MFPQQRGFLLNSCWCQRGRGRSLTWLPCGFLPSLSGLSQSAGIFRRLRVVICGVALHFCRQWTILKRSLHTSRRVLRLRNATVPADWMSKNADARTHNRHLCTWGEKQNVTVRFEASTLIFMISSCTLEKNPTFNSLNKPFFFALLQITVNSHFSPSILA